MEAYINKIIEFASFLTHNSAGSTIRLVEDISSILPGIEFSKEDLVIIPNAIFSLQQSPHLLEPIKELFGSVDKTFLYDDINSFPDTGKLISFIKNNDFPVEFFGYVNDGNRKVGTVALISHRKPPQSMHTPDDFKVIALIPSYNEEDVIVDTINQLNQDGIGVYVIDNWSNDRTYDLVNQMNNKGVVGIERWPASGAINIYDWNGLLLRQEELALELEADWYIRADADEIRESPWEGLNLRDAIYWVDKQGYNAINFTVLIFCPVDNDYGPDINLRDYFKFYKFSQLSGDFFQIKAWKKTDHQVNLREWGGNQVLFPDRKIYPYKFLMRHYPIRSQTQGYKKLFHDRMPRYTPYEKEINTQYDEYLSRPNFLKNPKSLLEFNSSFYTDYLLERLSGIGIIPKDLMNLLSTFDLVPKSLVNNIDAEENTAKRDQVIQTLSAQKTESEQIVQSLNAQLVEKERSSQVLATQISVTEQELKKRDEELSEIKKSKVYVLALYFRRIRLFLVPLGSFRERFFRKIVGVGILTLRKYRRL